MRGCGMVRLISPRPERDAWLAWDFRGAGGARNASMLLIAAVERFMMFPYVVHDLFMHEGVYCKGRAKNLNI